jgi:hypothetical protein
VCGPAGRGWQFVKDSSGREVVSAGGGKASGKRHWVARHAEALEGEMAYVEQLLRVCDLVAGQVEQLEREGERERGKVGDGVVGGAELAESRERAYPLERLETAVVDNESGQRRERGAADVGERVEDRVSEAEQSQRRTKVREERQGLVRQVCGEEDVAGGRKLR